DSARLEPGRVAGAVRLLLGDGDPAVRINALRALASFRDSTLAAGAAPLATDPDVNVAVQAETTLGALGGSGAVRALAAGLRSAVFALRRQAVIGLAQADSVAGVGAAAALASDPDWRWGGAGGGARGVVGAPFGAASPRPDDYLVRRVAAARLPDAAEAWGPVVPIATGKTDADYRDAVRRVLLPALEGRAPPRVTLETDRG